MNTEQSATVRNSSQFRWQSAFLAYGIVMFLVLLFGFFGNLFTLIVLRQREHRKKSITPLMMNLAIADLSIIVFGYPPVISSNLNGNNIKDAKSLCIWSGFVNGIIGMTSIATLTAMSAVVYQTIRRNTPHYSVSRRQSTALVIGTWCFGFATMFPPLVGWNRFVPGQSGFSCAPDWRASDSTSIVYIVYLIVVGFFLPLITTSVFHYLIHRQLNRRLPSSGNSFVRAQREKYQRKMVYMTSAIVGTFLLSWLPYCAVSIAATLKGDQVLTAGEAEIPELMAKASVIYNPIVYTIMSESFRRTLWGILTGNRDGVITEEARNVTANVNFSIQAEQSLM